MIKRRFFKAEHGEKDEASSDSSSSSSDSEADATEQSEDDVVADPEKNSESEDDDTVAEPKEDSESEASSSSGYESEDSSANVIDGYSSDDINTRTGIEILKKQSNATAEESVPDDVPDCILKCKSVYKCRICPRIICLTEETMRTHLISKRHARSEKLMKENRLKVMLNSDGEIENMDEETHAERHARTVALAQCTSTKKNKGGRQRQRKRLQKKKEGNAATIEKTTSKTKSPPKKRRKNEK
ncbi:STRESS RESPONSE PROTEIN [Salix viminalis]|uniref:STRESS RESPONSE PROTEIN n=1 Tax=Salix viminalis TaxID=40686 RepID=A0A9Q0QIS7_SALVM|nr:STRESS RESPONSE PROTEIN [Salix viminalis]